MFLALGRSLYQLVGSRLQFDHCSRSIQRGVRGFIGRARSAVTRAVVSLGSAAVGESARQTPLGSHHPSAACARVCGAAEGAVHRAGPA